MTPRSTRAAGSKGTVLVLGATGYVGGRLVPALLGEGRRVRVLARDPSRLAGRTWERRVEVFRGDVLRPETLPPAFDGIDTIYYLVHSMGGGADFHARDLQAARNVGNAAQAAGVSRIVYLGGLGLRSAALSEHLRSRQETGDVLRGAGIPVTELRAAVIVGSGSVSFEMIRYLTERLPVMICPHWVFRRIQPIAIRDVIAYLVAALERPESTSRVIEIGGADVVTYGEMMTGFARARGLHRLLIPVPVLTPRLSSYWVHLVTPIPTRIARPLIEGLRTEVVVRNDSARALFPEIRPMGYAEALDRALAKLSAAEIETAWSDALASSAGGARPPKTLTDTQGMIAERRRRHVAASPAQTFSVVMRLGGETGWLFADPLWRLRGLIDRVAGGPGFRRGRRDPTHLRAGDAVDFWRVERLVPDTHLLLRAEMRLPGAAWLQFDVVPASGGEADFTQTAWFAPRGLSGFVYWYALYPIHTVIFSGLVRSIARTAERRAPLPLLPRRMPRRRMRTEPARDA